MNSDSETENLLESSDEEFLITDSESDDDSLEDVRDWCKIDLDAQPPCTPKFPFTGNPGLRVSFGDSIDPLDYFNAYFTHTVLSFIVKETNRYAESFLEKSNLSPSSRVLRWTETNVPEMRRFIALLLLQGIVQKPMEKMFWAKRPIIATPVVGQIMTEPRYRLIMKFLHFENSAAFDIQSHPNPKLRKIYELHRMIIERFSSVYVPEQNIAVDESLIAFKGRLAWKQFIPSKRARFGIKLFQLCESESGYIWNSFIYTGKGTVFNELYENYGLSTKSVMTLLHDLKFKGYTLTTDNFYTSPELAELLIQCRTDICGTMKANRRSLPSSLKLTKLKKGEMIAFQKGKMCSLKWQDKKPLLMLSTFHNAEMIEVSSRKDSETKSMKPRAVVFYNSTMGGVDKSDQCLSYYPVSRNQQRKYYKKIFRHVLNQAVWNAFIIYTKNNGTLNHIQFRLKLIERLVEEGGNLSSSRSSATVKTTENIARLTGRHFPSYVQPNTAMRKHPSRKCKVCCNQTNENGKRVRRETRFECKDCDVGLCAAPCFEIFHTVKVL